MPFSSSDGGGGGGGRVPNSASSTRASTDPLRQASGNSDSAKPPIRRPGSAAPRAPRARGGHGGPDETTHPARSSTATGAFVKPHRERTRETGRVVAAARANSRARARARRVSFAQRDARARLDRRFRSAIPRGPLGVRAPRGRAARGAHARRAGVRGGAREQQERVAGVARARLPDARFPAGGQEEARPRHRRLRRGHVHARLGRAAVGAREEEAAARCHGRRHGGRG